VARWASGCGSGLRGCACDPSARLARPNRCPDPFTAITIGRPADSLRVRGGPRLSPKPSGSRRRGHVVRKIPPVVVQPTRLSPPDRVPSRDTAQVLGLVRWLLIAIFVVLGYFVLSYLAGVLAPILTALGVAYLLNPLLERLVRRGASRAAGAALLLASFVGS